MSLMSPSACATNLLYVVRIKSGAGAWGRNSLSPSSSPPKRLTSHHPLTSHPNSLITNPSPPSPAAHPVHEFRAGKNMFIRTTYSFHERTHRAAQALRLQKSVHEPSRGQEFARRPRGRPHPRRTFFHAPKRAPTTPMSRTRRARPLFLTTTIELLFWCRTLFQPSA